MAACGGLFRDSSGSVCSKTGQCFGLFNFAEFYGVHIAVEKDLV